jgi:hypothetical protein
MGKATVQMDTSLVDRIQTSDQARIKVAGIMELVFGRAQENADTSQLRQDRILAFLAVLGMLTAMALSVHALIKSDPDGLRFLTSTVMGNHLEG